MHLSLSKAGAILVFVPLVLLLVFAAIFAFFETQAEEESRRAFQAAQISNCSNKLIRDIFEVGSLSRGDISRLSSDQCKSIMAGIRVDLDELKDAVKGDPSQEAIVHRSAEAGDEAYVLIAQVRSALDSGDLFSAMNEVNLVKNKLRSCLNRMVSSDLLAMAQVEKLKAEKSHNRQADFRNKMQMLLIVGVILIVLFTLLAASIFYRLILYRLRILSDNSFRLASGISLNAPLAGMDEISDVDRSFHGMAVALAEAKQKEKSLVDNSLDVICSLDENGKFTAINQASRRICGFSEDDLLGSNIREIVIEDDFKHVNESLRLLINRDDEASFECRVRHENGKIIDTLWSVHWVASECLLFCIVHDITERKAAERLRQEVIAMVSHDLRTPIATVQTYLEMLGDDLFGELTERGEHLLKVAESNLGRMLNLSNDLLDLEKSKAGMLELNCSAVDLNKVISDCVQSLTGLAIRHEVQLHQAKTDLIVYTDEHRLTQVLANLLSNAIKFSPKQGAVMVSVERKNDLAWIMVSDQGRGVPEQAKETIFERFHQIEVADAVDKGGSGLGLAICKAIVELHGGKISVTDNEPRGSIFTFTIPIGNEPSLAALSAVEDAERRE